MLTTVGTRTIAMDEPRPWGVVVESPALVVFGWGKVVGWVLGAVVVLTRQLVGAPWFLCRRSPWSPLAGVGAAAADLCLKGREGRGGHQAGRAGCLGRGPWPNAVPAQQACRRRLELLPCRASREAEEREKELREEEKKREGAK